MYIEGLGDEVTIFLGVFAVGLVTLIGWWSTEVNRAGRIHTVLTITRITPLVTANREVGNNSYSSQENVNITQQDERNDELTHNSTPAETDTQVGSSDQSRETDEPSQPTLGSADIEESIDVKLKFLDDTHRNVKAKLSQTLSDFTRAHFGQELRDSKIVRLITNGRVLRDGTATLRELGFSSDCVIHCLIHRDRAPAENTGPVSDRTPHPTDNHAGRDSEARPRRNGANMSETTLDVGFLLFPLLGMALGVLWYCRCFHAVYFSVATTLALLGLSGLFVAAFVSNYPIRQAPANS